MEANKLLEALWADLPRSKYATGGEVDRGTYPMPTSIQVEGAGTLTLPLSNHDFVKLKAVSQQAPYGHGHLTVLNTDIRRAWQVEASKVSCPESPHFFSKVVYDLAVSALADLGVDAEALDLEVRLYKLLVYEQGGHFKVHRDTEKQVGMFATMILQLPTEAGHEGGQLEICHGKGKLKFDFSGSGRYFNTVFFCDCEHELAEVASGIRLSLVFSLVRNSGKFVDVDTQRLPHYISALGRVQQLLKQWTVEKVGEAENLFLAIPLGHQYTINSLSFAGLKGYDRVVAGLVLSCRSFLDIHLCMLEKMVTENFVCDLKYVNNYILSHWTTIDDRKVEGMERCKINIKNIMTTDLNSDPFSEDADPDMKSHIPYTGNDGGDWNSTYFAAVLVVNPKEYRMEALCNTQSPQTVLAILEDEHAENPSKTTDEFHRFFAAFLRTEKWEKTILNIKAMIEFCVKHNDRDGAFDIMSKFPLAFTAMIPAIQKYGWDDCYDKVICDILADKEKVNDLGVAGLPRLLRDSLHQDQAVFIAKQLVNREDIAKRGIKYLVELFKFCNRCPGLEEETWHIMEVPLFFEGFNDLVARFGEESFPRIEQILKAKEELLKEPFQRKQFLRRVAKLVLAINRNGFHNCARAFAKNFIRDVRGELYGRKIDNDMDAMVLLLHGDEKLLEMVEISRIYVTDLLSMIVDAANLIDLKKDHRLFKNLLAQQAHCEYFAQKGVFDVLYYVFWLEDEELTAEMLSNSQMMNALRNLIINVDIRLLKRTKKWTDASKKWLKDVVRKELDFYLEKEDEEKQANAHGKYLENKRKRLEIDEGLPEKLQKLLDMI